jgi:glycosyltransferase involved in cell wall biosynthesis
MSNTGQDMENEINPYITVISPVYGAAGILTELVAAINREVSKITDHYEVLLVEDHSPDNSWFEIEKICKQDSRVKGIKLSKNYGQHSAIAAGLHNASGDYVVVMDCDLQHNPKYIVDLLNKAREGFDVVYTVLPKRKHGLIKNLFAGLFHMIFNFLVGVKEVTTDGQIGTYSLITRKVVEAYKQFNDDYRPYLVILNLVGFNQGFQMIDHEKRHSGKSSYSLKRLFNHALNGIISQTNRLLMFSVYVGVFYTILSFIGGIYILIRALVDGFYPGWASLIILLLFNTGIILLFLGIIGMYISRIFLQVKGRPLYLIDRKINF